MTELLTAAQMRAIEEAAIASGDVTGLELMERAGRGVVKAVFAEWPELAQAPHPAVVLCGPGNNGGDGFVVARLLREWGWEVDVFLYGDPSRLPLDAKANYERWEEIGEVRPLTEDNAREGPRPTLLVDAMFGTGLTRAIPLELARAFHLIEKRDAGRAHPWLVTYKRVAVDCPSGMDCDSGRFLLPERPTETGDEEADLQAHWDWWQRDASQRLLRCDLSVAFHRKKIGHVLNEACGPVRVVDIGLGAEDRHPAHLSRPRSSDRVMALEFDTPKGRSRRIWPGIDLDKRLGIGRHKYDHGHVLILSGPPGTGGAARLAARGALRVGAGLVSVSSEDAAVPEHAARLDAIMLKPANGAGALAALLEDERLNAVCLGPGLGQARARTFVPVVCRQIAPRATVLDADALTAFADEPELLFTMLHGACVLTPHAGEFKRLFPDIAERLDALPIRGPAYSKIDATRDAAARAGCTVLYKGADTVIAAPDGRCSVNAALGDRAAPWLATAGSGDVLAGFITGLLGRGLDPLQAAETAAWLHVEAARSFGPGLIAEDLPEALPAVFRNLGL